MSLVKIRLSLLGFYLTYIFTLANAADVLVQLNVNRPFNDVSDKFVSFAIKPEELYRALDGDNRRLITRMAAMLGDSYVKFTNDYNFAMDSALKLRNPTNIIWKGFNRWSRAVNWTMIVPVPYEPETWDPMETLKILNSSYLNGFRDCVWQLGTDFGSSHAEDYVAELGTLNVMVETFRPHIEDWRIMGADISAGSSADETKRYIEMSRELNAAFGWSPAAQTTSANSLAAIVNENDAALRVLLRERVPTWLTLPQTHKTQSTDALMTADEATEALQWAKTLGDAASNGFDAVFKRITAADLERPNFSYYVSALFKKVMGSRVFPARPLNMFAKANKLYTHCANTVSGGIAFMIVNTNEQPLQVQVRSLTKMSATQVWQYTLTMKKSAVLLNDQRLMYNSTLKPQKTLMQANKPVLLSTPGRSVSFWVLPTANLEHCQYTEVVADEMSRSETSEKSQKKRYSSSDKLLRSLIQESSVTKSALARAISRRRRYAGVSRPKRFVLKDKQKKADGWGKLFKPLIEVAPAEAPEEELPIKKRENVKPARKPSPFDWFTDLMENTMTADLPLLKRGARSIDDDGDVYFGPLFATKDGRTTKAFTKKITEIKKPEQKIKPLFDMDEFDEEEFFQKMGSQREPEYPRLPDGDVILRHITNPDGEEIDEEEVERMAHAQLAKQAAVTAATAGSREPVNEMKPIKLLPTELYEGFAPLNPFKPTTNNFAGIGGALNSLLFPEPFTKKPAKTKKVITIEKDLKPATKGGASQVSQLAKEFLRAQKELSLTFDEDNKQSKELKDNNSAAKKESSEQLTETEATTPKTVSETELPADSKASSLESVDDGFKKDLNFGLKDFLPERLESFFGDQEEDAKSKSVEAISKPKFDEVSWWDVNPLAPKRNRRALFLDFADNVLHSNMIAKDEDLVPLGAMIPPEQLANYEYRAEDEKREENQRGKENGLVDTFKDGITNIVDLFSRHLGDWYNTFTRNFESSASSGRKNGAEVATGDINGKNIIN